MISNKFSIAKIDRRRYNGRAKLTEDQRLEIARLYHEGQVLTSELARSYGVSMEAIVKYAKLKAQN